MLTLSDVTAAAMLALARINELDKKRFWPEPPVNSYSLPEGWAEREHAPSQKEGVGTGWRNIGGTTIPLKVGQLRRDPQYQYHPDYQAGSVGIVEIVSIDRKRGRVISLQYGESYTIRSHRLANWPIVEEIN
jgi:hypothetical protein